MEGQLAKVVLCLDFSGSMGHLYSNGQVQELVERILPLGLAFDDNGKVDFYLFSDGVKKVPQNITLSNVAGYINAKILGKYQMGGTNYAPAIKRVVEDSVPTKTEGGGFMGKLFGGSGKKVPTGEKQDYPTYVIFITDGDSFDHKESEEAIKLASKGPVFFQFIGIGREKFPFLSKLDTMSGRFIDNANFFSISDLSAKSDDDLYKLLLTEFPSYVKEARTKGLIK